MQEIQTFARSCQCISYVVSIWTYMGSAKLDLNIHDEIYQWNALICVASINNLIIDNLTMNII